MIKDFIRYLKLLFRQWWFSAFVILSGVSTISTFVPAFYTRFAVPRWVPLIVFLGAFFFASFRVYISEAHSHMSDVEALTQQIAALKVNPRDEQRRRIETILSVMPQNTNLGLSEIAALSGMAEDDALQALREMQQKEIVIPLDVDEHPKGTFWRRI